MLEGIQIKNYSQKATKKSSISVEDDKSRHYIDLTNDSPQKVSQITLQVNS